jgi:hypothetical protein
MFKHPLRWVSAIAVVLLASAVLTPANPAQAAPAWQPKTPPLSTPWTDEVSPSNALPEYPRPQLVRRDWRNLNGEWQFTGAFDIDTPPIHKALPERVLVPFPIESALSGVQRHEDHMWYRRLFTVPSHWAGRRVKLNFGAANWETRVWVNGSKIGTHTGAYDAFGFDITDALHAGSNELIVGIYSPLDKGDFPIGKQRLVPAGIEYTGSSGIWQTVWLEPVNAAHITRLDTTPNLDAGALDLVVQGSGTSGQQVRAEVIAGGITVGLATGTIGNRIRVPVPNARLWSPDDPFLYDLKVSLTGPGGGDAITGYFGMRSLGKAMVNGVLRPTLNGKFVYQLGTLDQGFWPDGSYTAPTDAALRFDLERQKELGFNMVRKHIKIEPARWFYHADRLGLLVWQDMPSLRSDITEPTPWQRVNFELELTRIVEQLKGITSIVQWVAFNEGWGEYEAGRIADLVKSLDPTRLVNHDSGANCCVSDPDPGNGDVIDDHHYQAPLHGMRPPSATRVAMIGEFGGLGRAIPGHEWQPGRGFAYGPLFADEASLTARYVEINSQVRDLITSQGVSGSVYTEPYDVQNEINGFYTYDRRILKINADEVRAVNRTLIDTSKGTWLPTGGQVSLRVTTSGSTDRYLRHADSLGRTDVVDAGSSDTLKLDSTFRVRPGLDDPGCYSFETRNVPGRYLRHSNLRIRTDAEDGSAQFRSDATFCARPALAGGGTSFESKNLPGHFIRHRGGEVFISRYGGTNVWDDPGSFNADSTWQVSVPWWHSSVDLPVDLPRSLQVTSPGHTDRFLRHQNGLARADVVDAASNAALKGDATFVVRRGLDDPTCYSFESRNRPGQYLRHANFRVSLGGDVADPFFRTDATFCAHPGKAPGSVRLASVNVRGHNLRHINSEVWIATLSGPDWWNSGFSYADDVSWAPAPAWSP